MSAVSHSPLSPSSSDSVMQAAAELEQNSSVSGLLSSYIVAEIPSQMEFNVDHLPNINSTPSEEQRNNLQNSILQLDKAISDISDQTPAMQAKILVLQTKRTQLVQQQRCYSSPLSPVRSLPFEIFGEIFVYATCDRPRHVLNLSAVCQLWRDAALSTPVLWSTLELGHHRKRHKLGNHVDSWIERAHSYPLTLVIRKRKGFLDPVHRVRTLITKHQWKSITLDSDDTSILSIVKELEFSNLEMLESFSLALQFDDFNSKSSSIPPVALRCAPNLKTLNLDLQYDVAFDTLPFPWRQLTSLTMTFWSEYSRHIDLDILQTCVNLEELTIDYRNWGISGSNDLITLNYLRKLHILCYENMFLLFLDTPSIQDFAVIHDDYFGYTDGVRDYVKKNGSTLLKLSIAPYHGILLESIPNLRSLVKLRLDDCHYDTYESTTYEVLSFLVVNPEMEPSSLPLPRLEELEVICKATEENQRMFVEVIASRWWSDEEENAKQKQGQRSLARIKRSVLMNVHIKLNMLYGDDVDILRAKGMSIEYLAPFDGMDGDLCRCECKDDEYVGLLIKPLS